VRGVADPGPQEPKEQHFHHVAQELLGPAGVAAPLWRFWYTEVSNKQTKTEGGGEERGKERIGEIEICRE
jgi:hypothetical protein